MIIAALATVLCFNVACAAPAFNGVFYVPQPDGSTFRAVKTGDEFANFSKTDTGFPIVLNPGTGYWEYGRVDSAGNITASGLIVGKDAPAGIERPPAARILAARRSASRITTATRQTNEMIDNTGNQYLLVIAAAFTDKSLTTSESDWQQRIFGSSGSVKDYYKEVSYGQLQLLPAPESYGSANNGVVVVTVPHSHPNSDGEQTVADVIHAADSFVDFSSFDRNTDGKLTSDELHLVIILAGYEKSYGEPPSPGIWAHNACEIPAPATADGVQIGTCSSSSKSGSYTMVGELMYNSQNSKQTTIGVIAHEVGHSLGLPDLYDTENSSEGVGSWSIMGSGNWNTVTTSGDSPAHPDAWSKWLEGWAVPRQVTGPES
ncbi:MAG TPA: M6 family metalloprotease domain-containing protein, partial [bacterium]|nr:M6 family metalloprotease domain-containing protein [bacterium]